MRRGTLVAFAVVAVLAGAERVVAHHSFAAFDRANKLTLKGVVKEFQWNNPHTWIQIVVTDDRGRQTEWGVECASPNIMARNGWKRTTLRPGDKVVAVVNPLKDGRQNAVLVTITLPDGKILGPGDALPPRPVAQR